MVSVMLWAPAIAVCDLILRSRYKRKMLEQQKDHRLEIEAMAVRHAAAVRSMEEAHTEEAKHLELLASELREDLAKQRERAKTLMNAMREVRATSHVLADIVGRHDAEAGR